MSQFRFSLARVFEWYEKQLQLEKNRLSDCETAVANARRGLAAAQASWLATESATVQCSSISSNELRALELFRHKSRLTEKRLIAECNALQSKFESQLEVVKVTQRKVRLLEKLRDRRLAEHVYAVNRELDELASDSFLAKFVRER